MNLIIPLVGAACGFTLFAQAENAGNFTGDLPSLPAEETLRPFGTFFGIRDYSPTFGLSLWQSDENILQEFYYPGGDEEKHSELKQLTAPGEVKSLLQFRNYAELGFNRQLRFVGDQGSAVLLRVRDKFQLLNEESGAAQFSYGNDFDADREGSKFKGAVMVDIYNDFFYNQKWKKNTWVIDNPYRFWARVGLEWDYQDLNPANERDMFRQYALLTFQANPDQDIRLFGNDLLQVTSPQIVQIGIVREDNRITGEDDMRWILGWEPRLLYNEGWFRSKLGRGFGLNNRMYYKKESFGQFATAADPKSPTGTPIAPAANGDDVARVRSTVFSFINPYVGIEGSADSRVTLPSVFTDPDLGSLRKLQDEVFRLDLALGLGFDFGPWLKIADAPDDAMGTITFSYGFHGVEPVASLGDGHYWHELRADIAFKQDYASSEAGNNATSTSKNNWAGLTGFVSYVKGEPPPTHKSVDLLTAGVAIRF